jgi:hypothetical protein
VKSTKSRAVALRSGDYDTMPSRVVGLIDEARRAFARRGEFDHDCNLFG